jgi:flagellar biosynthesis/type III secretory pathway M-ring protein FliF/YscJ
MTTRQNWFLIVAMWVAILFAIFVFYWMMVRPVNIKRMCAEKAKQVSVGTKSDLSNMLEINRAIYLDCLRCNGIDK